MTAPRTAAYPAVQGRCPACRATSLFLGAGGYVTCDRSDCPSRDAATALLCGEVAGAPNQPVCDSPHLTVAQEDAREERQLAELDTPTDTAVDIPADKNGPTIANGQVSASELVDNAADNLHRYRAWLAAEHAKVLRAGEHPRPDLDHLRVTAHNGIAAGLEIAMHGVDCILSETQLAHDAGPTVAECRQGDRVWPLQREGE